MPLGRLAVPTARGSVAAILRSRRAWLLLALCAAVLWTSAAPPARARAAVDPLPAGTDRLLAVPRAGVAPEQVAGALRAHGIAVADGSALAGAVPVAVPPGVDPTLLATRIAGALGAVLLDAVESDAPVRAARLPGDPLYAARQSPYLEAIRAPEAWEIETGAARVTVAVIDTGVDFSHPDLRSRLHVNMRDIAGNGLDDDRNGCVDDQIGCTFLTPETVDPSCGPVGRALEAPRDDEGHGTFVAGLIAAAGDDALGVAGVAWDARILPVKVLDCTATGRISDAAAGIRYAARSGADVINISFGAPQDSRTLGAAINEALRSGATVVAAAGNRGGSAVDFPARYPGVISVGGAGVVTPDGPRYDRAAPFSPTGPQVQLLAPAAAIVGPLPAAACGVRGWECVAGGEVPGGAAYGVASGTSFAAPLVAGAAALLRAHHPDASTAMLRALLLGGAAPFATTGAAVPDSRFLDVAGALTRPLYTAGLPGTSRAGPGPLRAPR